jgi:hypothetical protein
MQAVSLLHVATKFSNLVNGDNPKDLFGPILLLVLTTLSWYFRPVDRKKVLVNQ